MQKLENSYNSNNYYTKLLSNCQFLNIMILENRYFLIMITPNSFYKKACRNQHFLTIKWRGIKKIHSRGFRNRRFLWLLMRGLLKNKKILHLGAWKRHDFSQWVKGHFKIVVSKSCKKSALYISERFFKKVFDWGLKKYWFSYRYIRCKIFFKIRVYETAKKWRIDEGIKVMVLKIRKIQLYIMLKRILKIFGSKRKKVLFI